MMTLAPSANAFCQGSQSADAFACSRVYRDEEQLNSLVIKSMILDSQTKKIVILLSHLAAQGVEKCALSPFLVVKIGLIILILPH